MGGIRDAKHPNQASLWESKIQLGERFFHEIITNPLPINMKILKAMKPLSAGDVPSPRDICQGCRPSPQCRITGRRGPGEGR